MNKTLLLLVWMSGIFASLSAQNPPIDPSFLHTYNQIIAYFPDIHTGGHYVEVKRALDGHPYYDNNKMENGVIFISGFEFSDVPLQYDIWDDLLLTFSPVFMQKMILNHQKVVKFQLSNGDIFVSKPDPGLYYHHNGFYREIVQGDISLYCKHRKEKKQESSTVQFERYYNEIKKYLIEVDNELIPVPRKKMVYELLQLQKKEAKPVLKAKGLRFKKNREAYLSTLVKLANEKRNLHE